MIPPVAHNHTDEKPNMVSWKNTFSMRQISLMNLAASQLGNKNGSKNIIPQCRRNYSVTSPGKSLDLLRKNLQAAINKDIDNVIKKYLEKFFEPAMSNIRDNLGKHRVGEDHIKEVCRNILEDAKLMYKIAPGSRDSSPYDFSDSDASIADSRIRKMSPPRKRKEFEPDSDPSHKRHKSQITSTDFTNYKLPIKREGPKWNPDRITENTHFIMGPRANKVLGYGQTRGRLYVRHPELVRYSGDQEDKEWLASKNLMPPSGGKAYLMILDDIKELTGSDDYKNNPNLQLHELKGFEAPPFLINKVKVFIQQVRTDRKDCIDFRSLSVTPPVVSDSAPSTPTDTQIVDTHSSSTSTSTKSEGAFIHIPDISPSSNNSIISSTMTQSPIPSCGEFLTPNMLMSITNTDIISNQNIMILKDMPQEVCLSSLLSTHINENALNF